MTAPEPGNEPEHLREKILAEAPRLGPDDLLTFACQPGVACFNRCCADVNIFLSPYDVLRLRKRLGMTSGEFLEKYTLLPVQKDMRTPVVILRMNSDESQSCPFVTPAGCGVYSDRPWPCRMYPLGLAAQKDTADGWRGEHFHFLIRDQICQGHEATHTQTVQQWLASQGVEEYDEWGEQYKELTLHNFFEQGGTLSPKKMSMFFIACYDLDKFREFVFESSLLERFEVDEDFVAEMSYDDEALLRFAFLWLRFSLFGERTVKVREEAAEAARAQLAEQRTLAAQSAQGAYAETR
ncbi:MAG: YkgJ family cysteine cluster protein [Isosphaeraceae bacterium]